MNEPLMPGLTLEYRVIYTRVAGRKTYRIFQRKGTADRFMAKLQKTTRLDLPPLTFLKFETRVCGEWSTPTESENTP